MRRRLGGQRWHAIMLRPKRAASSLSVSPDALSCPMRSATAPTELPSRHPGAFEWHYRFGPAFGRPEEEALGELELGRQGPHSVNTGDAGWLHTHALTCYKVRQQGNNGREPPLCTEPDYCVLQYKVWPPSSGYQAYVPFNRGEAEEADASTLTCGRGPGNGVHDDVTWYSLPKCRLKPYDQFKRDGFTKGDEQYTAELTKVVQFTELVDQLTAIAPNWAHKLDPLERAKLCLLAFDWCADMQHTPQTDLRWFRHRWGDGLPPATLQWPRFRAYPSDMVLRKVKEAPTSAYPDSIRLAQTRAERAQAREEKKRIGEGTAPAKRQKSDPGQPQHEDELVIPPGTDVRPRAGRSWGERSLRKALP